MASTVSTEAASATETTGRKAGSKTLLNFWLDAALGLTITALTWVSAMLQIVFPRPTSASGWQLWGLSYDEWRDVQFVALCVGVLLALEHVVLHWKWICGVVTTKIFRVKSRPDEGVQAMYGIATFVTIMLVLNAGIIIALFCVRRPIPG